MREPARHQQQLEQRLDRLRIGLVGGMTSVELDPPLGSIETFLDQASDEALIKRARRDFLPIPGDTTREGYHPGDPVRYWQSGLKDYDRVVEAARQFGVAGARVFDFGGSTGRVFRHFYCQDRRFAVWSSDFNVSSFRWNQRYMPSDIGVFINTATPTLPIPDRYFDIITAFSVFTHIDELESAWLLELRRVLRPRGLFYVTIHDEAAWRDKTQWLLEAVQRSTGGENVTADTPFPAPRAAFHWTDLSHYSCNVFHSRDYVETQWSRYFRIIDFRPGAAATGNQCVVLLTYDE